MIYDWDKINQQLNDFKSQIDVQLLEQIYSDEYSETDMLIHLLNKMVRLTATILTIAEDMCLPEPMMSCSDNRITINIKRDDSYLKFVVTEFGYETVSGKDICWDSLVYKLSSCKEV